MRKKILAFVFAAALLMAMAVPMFGSVGTASAATPGCPAGSAGDPGRGSDGLPGADLPDQAQRDGHGPGSDRSAHGSGDNPVVQKNLLRCNPPIIPGSGPVLTPPDTGPKGPADPSP